MNKHRLFNQVLSPDRETELRLLADTAGLQCGKLNYPGYMRELFDEINALRQRLRAAQPKDEALWKMVPGLRWSRRGYLQQRWMRCDDHAIEWRNVPEEDDPCE